MRQVIKYVGIILLIIGSSIFGGCASNPKYRTGKKSVHSGIKYYRTTTVANFRNRNKSNRSGKEFYAVVSFYGKKFHGRQTANGEIFDMYKMTCAHKKMAFNTKLKIFNEDNGKSVIVRVNDRGPFIKGRDIDLSYGAAKKLGIIGAGVKKVKVKILN